MSTILKDMSNDYYLSSMEYMLANLNGMIFNERAYFKIDNRSGAWSIEVCLRCETEEDDEEVYSLTKCGDNAFYMMCQDFQELQDAIVECLEYVKVGELLYYNVGTLQIDYGRHYCWFHGNGIIEQAKNALEWLKGREENNGNDF